MAQNSDLGFWEVKDAGFSGFLGLVSLPLLCAWPADWVCLDSL